MVNMATMLASEEPQMSIIMTLNAQGQQCLMATMALGLTIKERGSFKAQRS